MSFNTAERRFNAVTLYVSAVEVRRSLGCSRATAYEGHVRQGGVRRVIRFD